jgi:hypothetical protein
MTFDEGGFGPRCCFVRATPESPVDGALDHLRADSAILELGRAQASERAAIREHPDERDEQSFGEGGVRRGFGVGYHDFSRLSAAARRFGPTVTGCRDDRRKS